MLSLIKKINQKILIGISLLVTSKYIFSEFVGRAEGIGNFISTFPDIGQFLISTIFLFFTIYLLIKISCLFYLKFIKLNFILKFDFYIHLILISLLLLLTIKTFALIGDYNWKDIVKLIGDNKILKKILNIFPFFIIFLFIFYFEIDRKKFYKYYKFLAQLGFLFIIVFVLRLTFSTNLTANDKNDISIPTSENKKKIIFIVFDEFDSNYFFQNKEIFEKSKNFKQLSKSSVVFKNAYSQSINTALSVPPMLIGEETLGNIYINEQSRKKLFVKIKDDKKKEFSFDNSIFKLVENYKGNSAIFGYYLPYCDIFKKVYCENFPLKHVTSWKSGICYFFLQNLSNEFCESSTLHFAYKNISSNQFKKIDLFLENTEEANLKYIHLKPPHMPGNFAMEYFKKKISPNLFVQYDYNILLADAFLQKITKYLKNKISDETLLIVVSDHHLREISTKEIRPVFFMLKFMNDNSRFQIDIKTSTIHLKSLIEKYLKNEIKNNKDIYNFYNNKLGYSYFKPND